MRGGEGGEERGDEGGTGGRGTIQWLYTRIFIDHDPSVRESTFINKIAYMVEILSSPIRP